MGEDLEARVPAKGLMDCQMDKGETPLRMRLRREERRKTLGELWREAQSKRDGSGEEGVRDESSPSKDGAVALEEAYKGRWR